MEQRQWHVMSLSEFYSGKLCFYFNSSSWCCLSYIYLPTLPESKIYSHKTLFSVRCGKGCCIGKTFGQISCARPSSANQHLRDFLFWELVFKMLINTHFIKIFGWEQVIRMKKYFVRLLWRKHLSRFLVVQIIRIPPRSWDTNPLFNRKSKPDFFKTFWFSSAQC